ncbi:MAG: DUF4386 domain-containing protein [Ktedonobacterales bacterium]
MNSAKKTAITAGVLFIIATAASLLSTVFLNPILQSPDYLVKIAANENQVMLGALFSLIGGLSSAGIAISLYPILRRFNEGLALGSVGFRIIEGMLYIVGVIGVLLLVTLSQAFVKAGAPDVAYFHTIGTVLLAEPNWASLTAIFAFYLGGLMYYLVFYQSKLIPRWLSGWGIAGVLLGLVAAMLVLFGVTSYMSTTQVVLNLPIAVQEIVLAVWLIITGFNPTAIAAGFGKTI